MATKSFIKTIGSKGLLSDYNTSGKKLQTELTAGDNITIDGNTISSNQIFVAKYGVTKYAEVKTAYDAGKICTVYYASRYYYMIWVNRDYIEFMASNESNTLYHVSVSSGNKWSTYTSHLQSKLTFDSEPKAGSNNPVTSDGIKTAIDAKQNSLTAGDNITIDGNTISSDQVFVATYGTTTYAEVKAAYDAGKICTVFRENRYYYIMEIRTEYIRFGSVSSSPNIYSLKLTSDNKWSVYSLWLQPHLTFDSAPTAGSSNPVTSDGIKTALDSRIPAPTSTTGTQVLKCIDGVIQWVTE